MSRTISRSGTSARKAAARQGAKRKVRAAKARTGSLLDRLMALSPFSEAQLQRIFLGLLLGLAVIGLFVAASIAGVPAMAHDELASLSHDAGFEVKTIKVSGVHHLNAELIYRKVDPARHQAMPFVDPQAIRAELREIPWVADARVSRQLPDTIAIDIVEARPRAVLRRPDGSLALIDSEGRELDNVGPAGARGYMVLGGEGVGGEIAALGRLLDAAPAMRPQVVSADWVGNRRWNLTFRTRQILMLPEGETDSAQALLRFARIDGTDQLIGGKGLAFDFRAADRFYIRLPEQPGAPAPAHRELAAAAPAPVSTKAPAADREDAIGSAIAKGHSAASPRKLAPPSIHLLQARTLSHKEPQ